jgi:hypothetical protein
MSLAATLKHVTTEQMGFLRDSDLAIIAREDRLRQVLIRCGNGRFTCAAQDVAHFIGIIKRDGADYVRDVSLLASDPAFRGQYHAHTFEGSCRPQRQPVKDARRPGGAFPEHSYTPREDYGGAFDGINVVSDADPGL